MKPIVSHCFLLVTHHPWAKSFPLSTHRAAHKHKNQQRANNFRNYSPHTNPQKRKTEKERERDQRRNIENHQQTNNFQNNSPMNIPNNSATNNFHQQITLQKNSPNNSPTKYKSENKCPEAIVSLCECCIPFKNLKPIPFQFPYQNIQKHKAVAVPQKATLKSYL